MKRSINNEKDTKIVCSYNTKGGVGKTTISCLLAYEMEDKDILIIDLDCQSNITRLLNETTTEKSMLDVLRGECTMEEATVKSPNENYPNIDLIGSNRSMRVASEYVSTQNNRERVLARIFKRNIEFISKYDLIIFDMSPNIDILNRNALVLCDIILSAVTSGCILSLDGIDSYYAQRKELFEDLEEEDTCTKMVFINEKESIKKNIVDMANNYLDQCEDVKKHLMETSISRTTVIEKAIVSQLSIKDYLKLTKTKHKIEMEFDNFVNEFKRLGGIQ